MYLEVPELEPRRRAVVQIEDDALRRVTTVDMIPAWVRNAGSVGRVGSEVAGEVDKGKVGDAGASFVGIVWAGAFVLVVVAGEMVRKRL